MRTFDARLFEISNKYGDFRLAHSSKGEDGYIQWSKHRTVLECAETDWGVKWMEEKANHRQIYKNEIVLDKDDNSSKEWFESTCNIIQEWYPFDYEGYWSGSRGYHIHLIYPKLAFMTREERESFREQLIISFGCDAMKKSDNCLIARENMPHWKTGVRKTLLRRHQNGEEEN